MVSMRIMGADELARRLKNIPKAIQKKVLRQAMRSGAKIIQAEAKRLAPVKSGELKRSIKVRTGKAKKRGDIRMVVITGDRDFRGDQYYGAFVEYGHRVGQRSGSIMKLQKAKNAAKKRGDDKAAIGAIMALDKADKRAFVPAKPYMRPAFDNTRYQVIAYVTRLISEGVEREAAGA